MDDDRRETNERRGAGMAEMAKVLYILVVDGSQGMEVATSSFKYTRPVLQSTLQFMGCKPRHAFELSDDNYVVGGSNHLFPENSYRSDQISQRVFELIRNESSSYSLPQPPTESGSEKDVSCLANGESYKVEASNSKDCRSKCLPFELYKKRTTAVVRREAFYDLVCDSLNEYKYVGPNQRGDLALACRIRERKESMTILLCGTSGCGKSTLSALLGGRLGITTVVSTDSIRHMMRSFANEKQNPLLWASTYHAGDCLDTLAVTEAKAKRKAKKMAVIAQSIHNSEFTCGSTSRILDTKLEVLGSEATQRISDKQMAVEGFKAQSEMVIESLDRLITAWEERKESVIVEGVHLSLNFVMGLMKNHPSIIPFMIYITDEDKHLERFAVRAKYMTLDPAKNKYVKYIRNIRTIQEYLCKRADKHLVPKINNTNVDKSVAAIHATLFGCLRRRETGEQLYDSTTNTVELVDEEYRNQVAANSLSSKGMFQLIQRKGSSRRLMALLNIDGSVAKAWPVDIVDSKGRPIYGPLSASGLGNPMYGPLKIGKSEPVNLQFGNFGISAWPTDGGTSHAGSVDELRAEWTNIGSRYHSSCCSSPKMSDGPAKELKEETSVHGSDEEIDDPLEVDSDEDYSDGDSKKLDHEQVGSVDEQSTKSDEEYDDLALQDVLENAYWSDNDGELSDKVLPLSGDDRSYSGADKYTKNLNLFLRGIVEMPIEEPWSCSSMVMQINERTLSAIGNAKTSRRSLSISALESRRPLMFDPIHSEAPQG